jgi:predicted ATPase
VEEKYPGVFNDYTAGIIAAWQNRKQNEMIAKLRTDLEFLGLTWKVEARQLDDTSVELLVGRLPHAQQGGARDLVNIADVGFGVSQTLPVVVALLVAAPGQLVYLEQPEIHLHPRAQAAFAKLLRAAVVRGVKVVVETHSALLIRAIQTLVANGNLKNDDVALHWFSRDMIRGWTVVTSATLDRFGSFGDWPEDFDEVTLKADHEYLTAAEAAEATAK